MMTRDEILAAGADDEDLRIAALKVLGYSLKRERQTWLVTKDGESACLLNLSVLPHPANDMNDAMALHAVLQKRNWKVIVIGCLGEEWWCNLFHDDYGPYYNARASTAELAITKACLLAVLAEQAQENK